MKPKSGFQGPWMCISYGCAWDGCAPGRTAHHSRGAHRQTHSQEVAALVDKMNSFTDPTGRPYQFLLTTWEEEGTPLARYKRK